MRLGILNGMETEAAFHFHAATMTATNLFLLQLSVASGCAGTISQSGRRKDSFHFAARPLSPPFYSRPFLTSRA
jgi:hypothetical protein